MLAGDFYTILSIENEPGFTKAVLELNAAHNIFSGHFPLQPVVPGVCMMQMIKELVEQLIEFPLNLVRAEEMKFLVIIDPVANNIIEAALKYTTDDSGKINVTASLAKDELVHFKFKGSFTKQTAL